MKTVPARETSLQNVLILIAGISLFTGCFSTSSKVVILGPVPEYQEKNSIIEVIDHENPDENMPEWVVRYLSTGAIGIETLPKYENRYVFIGKQRGNNLDSLSLWATSFSIDRDFSRLVSARIQARFTRMARGNPGEEFGRYFETVIKNSSDTAFSGASQEDSFWIKKRILGDDVLSPIGESFEYYVLISIERENLEKQINLLLTTARPDLPPTREQSTAAMRLRLIFYEEF
ncbi:hypothetical protein [Treponema primitia]|uniref:hypothetical protein n=1 Tax=Treponema primitia TaxID=88058 RepID=UPI0002555298|nr:hypothetical protein [Treponema primitia]